MSEALLNILSSHNKNYDETKKFSNRLAKLESRLYRFKELIENSDRDFLNTKQVERINQVFKMCVKEAVFLKRSAILIEQATQEEDLEQRLTKIIKEMRNMSKSNSRNIFDFLFEGEEEVKEMDKGLDEAELSLELSDEEREDLAGAEDADAVDDDTVVDAISKANPDIVVHTDGDVVDRAGLAESKKK